jgi:hypothetical protein
LPGDLDVQPVPDGPVLHAGVQAEGGHGVWTGARRVGLVENTEEPFLLLVGKRYGFFHPAPS